MDSPKILGNEEALQLRLSQIEEGHIAPLTDFVRRLREKKGPTATIPFIDPWDGGVNAELLFLLEAPGAKARDSGFISMNNPDETAKNFFELLREAGIKRKRIITWNAVPWYIGSDSRIRPANKSDISEGIDSLQELMHLLPNLRAVALLGRKAQKATKLITKVAPGLELFMSPHPSPMFVNRKPENREILLSKMREIQAFLDL